MPRSLLKFGGMVTMIYSLGIEELGNKHGAKEEGCLDFGM